MFDRPADSTDEATLQEAKFTNHAIAQVVKHLAPQTHPDFTAPWCLECGEEMPRLRIDAGRIRCTDCETIVEQQNKLRRKL